MRINNKIDMLLDKYTVEELEYLVKQKKIEVKKIDLEIAKKKIIKQKINK